MEIVSAPQVVRRPEVPYVAFMDRVPFKGFEIYTEAMRSKMLAWLQDHPVDAAGPPFLRLHVIDLSGRATVSAGVPVASLDEAAAAIGVAAATARVPQTLVGTLPVVAPQMVVGVLPAGRYATLTYVNHGVKANLMLVEWCAEQGFEIERLRDDTGNTFVARVETLLTDPVEEPRASHQQVRLDFKIVG
jgi:hypothetical protein